MDAMKETLQVDCDVPSIVGVLVLKSAVLFPLQVVSVQVGIRPNLRLLEDHPGSEEIVAAGVFLDPDGTYHRTNLSSAAVACRVLSRIQTGGGTIQVVLQGLRRLNLKRIITSRPYFKARADCPQEPDNNKESVGAAFVEVTRLIEHLVRIDERFPDELAHIVRFNVDNPSRCADLIADTVGFGYSEKRQMLEETRVAKRLKLLTRLLRREIHRTGILGDVLEKTGASIDLTERRQLLREQLEIIRHELVELDPMEGEIAELSERTRSARLPSQVAREVEREIQRLRDGDVEVLEGLAIRAYVDWAGSLPWQETTKPSFNMRRARRLLNDRFFGLGAAQTRLLEFIAVRKLGGQTLPLLAIVGPPGTGKTSLGGTLADILNRELIRIPMGEIHEAAQIRGIRWREVAARPGRVLDAMRHSGARNPVILIDDIHRLDGDLVAPMLEVLDPARNSRFIDHYLGAPFDLSQALFVLTANVEEELPERLWEYVDVVTLSGYTNSVKLAIAVQYVWPAILKQHGLTARDLHVTRAAVRRIISAYTREAGIRELSNHLERICRQVALKIAIQGNQRFSVNVRNLKDYLGRPPFGGPGTEGKPLIGAVMGLAWTETGGDLLPVEALLMPGSGKAILTGLLGEVLQESVQAALSYVRSHATELEIPPEILQENDLHVHFPEGAIPKDGPSAGIAVATTIASLLANRPVSPDIAMTGEISLQGRVLPVGGIQEKVLAAYRAGIREVILPKANESDVAEVPPEVRRKVRITLVGEVLEVFRVALGKKSGSRRLPPVVR